MQTEQMKNDLIRLAYYAAVIFLIWAALKYLVPFMMPFILGFLIALLLRKPADLLTRKWHGRRTAACILLLILFYFAAAVLTVFLGSRLLSGLTGLIRELPALYEGTVAPSLEKARLLVNSFLSQFSGIPISGSLSGKDLVSLVGERISGLSGTAVASLTGMAGKLPSLFIGFLLTIVSSFFFTIDYHRISAWTAGALPDRASSLLGRIRRSSGGAVFGFLRAYAILFCITLAELSLGFTVLRIPGSIPLALLVAVVDILPILGAGTALIPWGIVLLILGDTFTGAGLLVLYVVITAVRQSLEPRIVGKQIGLYPIVTLICMFVGAKLFGFLGLFLLPVAATVFVRIRQEDKAVPSCPGGSQVPRQTDKI